MSLALDVVFRRYLDIAVDKTADLDTVQIRAAIEALAEDPAAPIAITDEQRFDMLVAIAFANAESSAPDPLVTAKQSALLQVDAWWSQQAGNGIDIGNGVKLKADSTDATQLQLYVSTLAADEDAMVSDVNLMPHVVVAADVPALVATYKTEFTHRRGLWAQAKFAIQAAGDETGVAAALSQLSPQ